MSDNAADNSIHDFAHQLFDRLLADRAILTAS
jgi:hypothetical protein